MVGEMNLSEHFWNTLPRKVRRLLGKNGFEDLVSQWIAKDKLTFDNKDQRLSWHP